MEQKEIKNYHKEELFSPKIRAQTIYKGRERRKFIIEKSYYTESHVPLVCGVECRKTFIKVYTHYAAKNCYFSTKKVISVS